MVRCSHCRVETLVEAEHEGVPIELCPKCRGVWVRPDGLDELLEAAAVNAIAAFTHDLLVGPAPDRPVTLLALEAERRSFARLARARHLRQRQAATARRAVPASVVRVPPEPQERRVAVPP